MDQRTWPYQSNASRFSALPLSTEPSRKSSKHRHHHHHHNLLHRIITTMRTPLPDQSSDFTALPYDLLTRIAAPFNHRELRAASLVCKSWCDALQPLRESMAHLRWGKLYKHGRAGYRANAEKALESFLKGAERGSSLAMVDAGLMYWEMGKKEDGVRFYLKAAQLGDPSGMCNLGIAYLQADSTNTTEAVKWLLQSASAGHVRAQYQLALCLHQGRGIDKNIREAAKWYLRAAEGGYVRAMYNASLCFSAGEGFAKNHPQAKKWMKCAADHGHKKAQFEHGINLFSEGDRMKAAVYLELASRAGEVGAFHVKDVIFRQLPAASRDWAIYQADKWRALPSSR